MTLDEFAKLYPQRAFTLRYVERGRTDERSMGFLLMWTADYFTSDSDRLCEYPKMPRDDDVRYLRAWGETIEQAIDLLLKAEEEQAERAVDQRTAALRESEARLASLREHRKR